MWRILTIIAGTLLLAVSAVLGFLNKGKLAEEAANRDSIQANVKSKQDRLAADKELLVKAEKDREEAQNVTKTLATELKDLKGKNEAMSTEVTSLQSAVTDNKDKIAKLSKDQEGAPDLDAIAEKITDLKKEQAKFAQEVADKEAQLVNTEAKVGIVQNRIKAAEGREEDIRKRISPSELKASIASVHQALGFVIINAGGNKGVVLGSNLAVMRGNEKVGELVVSSVEKNRSSADIVPGSLGANQMLMPGDTVVAVRPAPSAPKKEVTPKAGAEEKAPAEEATEEKKAEGDDIFGDSGAAAEEPKADDDAGAAAEEPKADDAGAAAEETPAEPAPAEPAPAEGGSAL